VEAVRKLRREVDRLFEDFQLGSWRLPFGGGLFDVQPLWRGEIGKAPAVDIVDTDKAYEITAELPGMDESNINVKFSDGTLMIKGEKRDDKEEKKKGYYLSERRYGAFQRSFRVPDGVDAEKIEANSRTACSRSRCQKRRRHRGAKRRSRSNRPDFQASVSGRHVSPRLTAVERAAANWSCRSFFPSCRIVSTATCLLLCGHIFRPGLRTSTAKRSIMPSRRIRMIRAKRNGRIASHGRRSSAPT
jgi:HSP20 family molecular chaperone IbpA